MGVLPIWKTESILGLGFEVFEQDCGIKHPVKLGILKKSELKIPNTNPRSQQMVSEGGLPSAITGRNNH